MHPTFHMSTGCEFAATEAVRRKFGGLGGALRRRACLPSILQGACFTLSTLSLSLVSSSGHEQVYFVALLSTALLWLALFSSRLYPLTTTKKMLISPVQRKETTRSTRLPGGHPRHELVSVGGTTLEPLDGSPRQSCSSSLSPPPPGPERSS